MSQDVAVVFEPHNDDFVIGMGATGIELLNSGWDIVSIVMTDGRYGGVIEDPEQTAEVRVAEKNQECNYLGTDVINMDYEDKSLIDYSFNNELRETVCNRITDILLKIEPDIVFVTAPVDGHPDHRATHDLVTSSITEELGELSIIEYTVWDIPFFSPEERSVNEIVISGHDEVFEKKLESIQIHESQVKEYPYDDIVSNFNRYLQNIYHKECDAEYVEAFHITNKQPSVKRFIDSVEAIEVTENFHKMS